MSKTRFEASAARKVAWELLGRLEGVTARRSVAGSLRRGKPAASIEDLVWGCVIAAFVISWIVSLFRHEK